MPGLDPVGPRGIAFVLRRKVAVTERLFRPMRFLSQSLILGAVYAATLGTLLAVEERAARPNVIVILADDMGFSDLGCFGSEIATPNLDKLAANGLRFTQFYNTSRCCPSRAALLTGLYSHQAGIGDMVNKGPTPAYQGYLNDKCLTLAEVLRGNGYATAIAGKWHVGGDTFSVTPWMRGFDQGITSAKGGFYYPDKHAEDKKNGPVGALWLNGKNIPNDSEELPKGWYTTDLYADFGIKYVNQAVAEKKPFFLYLAFNAPHWPLMAPAADIAKYRGKYLAGWDKLREQRHQKQLAMGIVDPAWALAPLPKDQPALKDVPAWETLSDTEKERSDKIMSLYAACVDHLDQAVGKVVENLKQQGVFENTLILFLSDNGGCHEGGVLGALDESPKGAFGPNAHCGQAWATLENTPFRYYKHWEHEGGISSPFIAHWPNGIKKTGGICKERAHIIDIMPTLVEVTGAQYPKEYQGKEIQPLEGKSLAPAFAGAAIGHNEICWEHEGNAAILDGDWKLVRAKGEPWELYDLSKDRSELSNLASTHQETVQQLSEKWQKWAIRVGVREVADPKGKKKQGKAEGDL